MALRTPLFCALVIPLLITPACQKPGNAQKITLHISPTHLSIFSDLKKKAYSGAEAEAVLERLAEQGERFCNNAGAAGFLKPDQEKAFPGGAPQEHYRAALLGCRNWYSMSDLGPDDDFMKVNTNANALGRHAFDCYAVGFLQPYIMAANLNCARLNIIDVDFRIIKAHLDFLNRIKARPGTPIRELMADIRFVFPAGGPTREKAGKVNLSVAELCGKNSETQCAHYLIQFLGKMPALREINLILSPLHEFTFLPDNNGLQSVLYSSNAFDPHFTTPAQFEQFRLGVGASPANAGDSDRLIIYHQAEERQFGIYKIDKALQVSTICADRFRTVTGGQYSQDRCRYFPGKSESYETYWDKISLNHPVRNPCSGQLLR